MTPYSIVVLASGSGSLLQSLIDSQEQNNYTIDLVITDRDCPAVERAQRANIATRVIHMGPNRNQWDTTLRTALDTTHPDLIVSAGFMRVLGAEIVSAFEGRLINIHPALLPKFPGAHAVRDALAAGVATTGTTVHFVDYGVDTGAIIAQKEVAILPSDDEGTLHERIKVLEQELLVEVVARFAAGKVKYQVLREHPGSSDHE